VTALTATWGIAALATWGVILRPWRLPEAIWAVTGAALLVLAGLLPAAEAWRGVARGTDVYLFLIGMMLLAEIAREAGLFDWLAAQAARHARGSATRLFTLVYLVGVVVTVFLSNDATAVVLTPAVAAVARAAKARNPLPWLLICAFVANAASFVLPISNPANLVIYGSHMPPLLQWLPRYALPSLLAIAATYAALRLTQRRALRQTIANEARMPTLSMGGRVAAGGVALTAAALMTASALGWRLGPPTFLAGLATAAAVLLTGRPASWRTSWRTSWRILGNISWGVLPLVAGLFVLVEALDRTGLIRLLGGVVRDAVAWSASGAAWASGIVLAFAGNLTNNLPAGLIAGATVQAANSPPQVVGAVLIGVDLGPNLSVTGSLATILWLAVLRREGLRVGAGRFLRLGLVVMPPALLLALGALVLAG
jgi:arsenical pump membrane protein